MSYTITDGDRCPVRMYSAAQCVLRDDHDYHHVTAGGAHFRGAGRRPVAPKLPEPLPAWFAAGDRVMGQSFDQWAQDQGMAPATAPTPAGFAIAITDGKGTIGKSAYSVSDLLNRNQQRADEFAAFKAGVEKTLEHLADQASRHANQLGGLGQTCDRLERTLGVESRERSRLADRVVKLEQLVPTKYDNDAAVVAEGVVRQLQGRLAELEQRLEALATLDDLHNWSRRHDRLTQSFSGLAERLKALEQRFELPPAAWGCKSPEPPRHQTYQDAEGDLWQCRDGRWFCVREGRSKVWSRGGDGLTWPFGDVCRHYFPWKVWNGRD